LSPILPVLYSDVTHSQTASNFPINREQPKRGIRNSPQVERTPSLPPHRPARRGCNIEHYHASGSGRGPRTARWRGAPPVRSCCVLPALSLPLAVVRHARSFTSGCRRTSALAPPRSFGCARLPCGGSLFSFLLALALSPYPPPRLPPVAKTIAGGAPDAGGARGRDGWFVLGCLSLRLSLNAYCFGSFLSFFSQCSLGCTHDTIA
jgi:hypothetical protein